MFGSLFVVYFEVGCVGRESWVSLACIWKKSRFFQVGFEGFRVWVVGSWVESATMNMMRRLKSIASGRTSISSDPVRYAFFFSSKTFFFVLIIILLGELFLLDKWKKLSWGKNDLINCFRFLGFVWNYWGCCLSVFSSIFLKIFSGFFIFIFLVGSYVILLSYMYPLFRVLVIVDFFFVFFGRFRWCY